MQNTKKEGTDRDLDLKKGFSINFPIPFFGVAKENVEISERKYCQEVSRIIQETRRLNTSSLFDFF